MYETPLLMVEDEKALETACAQLRGEPGPTGQSAQPLGWETRDILIDMGLDSALVDELIERGAAIQHPGVAAKDETPHA